MEIVIEKNVPMPGTDDAWKAMLDALEQGDSFAFPRAKRSSVASIMSNEFHALTDKRFRASSKDQPKGMMRVWRIKDFNPDKNESEEKAQTADAHI